MSDSDTPELVKMQRWTQTPPNDTGHYWFRAQGMNAAIARLFFVNGVSAFGKHDLQAHSVLYAEFSARAGFDGHIVEEINEPVATLSQRAGAQWSDGRIMPPEMRA